MKTVVYLIRHAKPLKVKNDNNSDSLQLNNEKEILSIEGEMMAKNKFDKIEFKNIDVLFSSNYVRAIATAKYLASDNDLDININSDFGERKFGITSWNELNNDFGERQFFEDNYKIGNGESQKEVRERMYHALTKTISENEGKSIAIVTHATAILFLLRKWCEISYDKKSNHKIMRFQDTVFFNGDLTYCQTFKLEFEKDQLTCIRNVDSL